MAEPWWPLQWCHGAPSVDYVVFPKQDGNTYRLERFADRLMRLAPGGYKKKYRITERGPDGFRYIALPVPTIETDSLLELRALLRELNCGGG